MSLKDAFSGLKEELGKDFQSENDSPKSEVKTNTAKNNRSKTKTKKSVQTDIKETSLPQKAKAQRKVGKRSNPEFTQAPAFIKKTTHQQVKVKLIMDSEFNDYSELVEALLVQWLKQGK